MDTTHTFSAIEFEMALDELSDPLGDLLSSRTCPLPPASVTVTATAETWAELETELANLVASDDGDPASAQEYAAKVAVLRVLHAARSITPCQSGWVGPPAGR